MPGFQLGKVTRGVALDLQLMPGPEAALRALVDAAAQAAQKAAQVRRLVKPDHLGFGVIGANRLHQQAHALHLSLRPVLDMGRKPLEADAGILAGLFHLLQVDYFGCRLAQQCKGIADKGFGPWARDPPTRHGLDFGQHLPDLGRDHHPNQ